MSGEIIICNFVQEEELPVPFIDWHLLQTAKAKMMARNLIVIVAILLLSPIFCCVRFLCWYNWRDERKNRIVVIILNKIFFIISLEKEPTSYDQDIPTISNRFNDMTVGNSKKWCWLNNYQSMCRLKTWTRTQHRNVKSDSYALGFYQSFANVFWFDAIKVRNVIWYSCGEIVGKHFYLSILELSKQGFDSF